MFATRCITRELAPRGGFEPPTFRLTAECSTVELPGSCATPLFSFYYSKQIHAMTIRNDVQNALAAELPGIILIL